MKMIRYLFLFAWIMISVLNSISAVKSDTVTIQPQSGIGRNPISDSRQNPQQPRDKTQGIQQDALKRLTKLVTEAAQIDDVAARVRVQARLADILWKRDEPRARAIFQAAYDDCRFISEPPVPEASESELTARITCGSARSEIMRIVTARDPEFAHRLAARITEDSSCSFGPRNRATYESAKAVFVVQIAIALAEKNPVTAVNLGKQSLQDGIAHSFPELLTKLKASNAQLANDLTYAAIARIESKDVNALEIDTLARYLLGENSFPSSENKLAESGADVRNALAVRFLDSVLAATTRFVSKLEQKNKAVAPGQDVFGKSAPIDERAGGFFTVLTGLLPSFERYHSTRPADARAMIERLGHWMDPIERAHMFVFYDNGDTPEGLVAEAGAYTEAKYRDKLYFLAASLADLKGDSDKALSIASRISDPERRENTIDGIWNVQVFKAISERRYAEAQRLVSKIMKPEGRIMRMLMIATSASEAGHKTQVIPLLDETTTMLLQTCPDPSPERAEVLMEIAQVYIKADIDRGVTAIENAIEAINTATSKHVDATTRMRFGRPVAPTDPLSLFGSKLSVFESLARSDYFRSLRLAESFEDRSLAIIAQLAAVRTALLNP